MIDLHVHTSTSHDGSGTVMEYCDAACSMGMRVLGFSNHLDVDPGLEHTGSYNHAAFVAEIDEARNIFGERLKILAGVEVTYQSEHEAELKSIIDSIDADYFIGSVHSIGGADFCVSEPEGAENYFRDKTNIVDAFNPYFEEILKAVKFGRFDIIGHMDGIRRYAPPAFGEFRTGDFYGVMRKILEGMARRDMALEINTSGLEHSHEEIYPSPAIAQLFKDVGGARFAFGCDAHCVAKLGRGWDKAQDYLRSLGVTKLSYFDKRAPKELDL